MERLDPLLVTVILAFVILPVGPLSLVTTPSLPEMPPSTYQKPPLCPTFGGDANPVEVACEFLGNVRLPSGRETDHHNHSRGICHVGRPRCM